MALKALCHWLGLAIEASQHLAMLLGFGFHQLQIGGQFDGFLVLQRFTEPIPHKLDLLQIGEAERPFSIGNLDLFID